jgi:endoglucanase
MHTTKNAQALSRQSWVSYVSAIFLSLTFVLASIFLSGFISYKSAHADAAPTINVWWPTDTVPVSGVQPFKAMVQGLNVEQYEMFWQVDGGQWVWMDNNYKDYPHKEATVDLTNWKWKGSGPYTLNFIVRQNGVVIAQKQVALRLNTTQPAPVVTTTTTSVTTAPAPTTTTTQTQTLKTTTTTQLTTQPVTTALTSTVIVSQSIVSTNSIFYIDPNSPAAKQATSWRTSRPNDAKMMDVLAAQPTAKWLGGWNADVQSDTRATVQAATAKNATAIFVLYNIPGRDCGGYSAGGTSIDKYASWVKSVATGIGSGKAIVILEPDALAGASCLSGTDQQKRFDLISNAVNTLKVNANTKVYIDGGHSGWLSASDMAGRMNKAGITKADGFFLNVSNFKTTANETTYGVEISKQLGNKHFVIDTSRNGLGPDGDNWCNPPGRAIGARPTTSTGNTLVDAYLWLKTPGESDGLCNGAPGAGEWWADYALGLVQRGQ